MYIQGEKQLPFTFVCCHYSYFYPPHKDELQHDVASGIPAQVWPRNWLLIYMITHF